ncbi:MAG: type II toxin-antitoxin system RelE/ParE family toxin [Oscillospiraceae bacterium]|nr:type II toxin-antitoxin system RelE/ParE family toxin [Oscillospiraceae bacterium]
MYYIRFYRDKNNNSPITQYIEALKKNKTKDSRIKLKKAIEYIGLLKRFGLRIGKPAIKHINGTQLWELRPSNDRIFFVYFENDTFILLHQFTKKTQKTPSREIEKALNNLKDFKERIEENAK